MVDLPLDIDLYSTETLKILSEANHKIGELKGVLDQLPNPEILLNAITLGEAKDSSEIENIVTTYDDLYKEMAANASISMASKEVLRYNDAMQLGWQEVQKNGFISVNMIQAIHHVLEPNKGGIRKFPGTVIKNTTTSEVLFTPPQSEVEILTYLKNFETYLNEDTSYDALINMALLHYQFETIHPFYDGNGRTGRILNVLYLVLKGKLDYPVLYLSKYINQHREEYYKLLRKCHQNIEAIHEFIQFMLRGIIEMSGFTLNFIHDILASMSIMAEKMQKELPKLYSEAFIEYLYSHFYTKIDFIKNEFQVTRQTAASYLKQLEDKGFLIREKVGKEIIYKNVALFQLMDTW